MFKESASFSLVLVTLLSLVFTASVAYSAGFQLFNELSAKTTGNSGAMSARYDAAELAWFNPAGAAMMKNAQITGGGALIFPSMELDNDGDDPRMKHIAYPVPYFYGAMPIMDQFGLSLSINSPYGLTTEWDNAWEGKYEAHYTNLTSVFFTPAISYRPVEWFAISAGPQIAYVEAEIRKYIDVQHPLYGDIGDVYTKVEGHDWSQGYIISAMLKPNDKWTFGVTFHSHVNFNIDGDAEYEYMPSNPLFAASLQSAFQKSDVYVPLDLPKTLSIAASTTAIKNFRFSVELLWTGWSSYKDLKFHYDKYPGDPSRSGVAKAEKSWNDVYSLRFGAEYFLDDQWTLRASYAWDESPIEDDYRDPSLPTNDRHIFGFGVGYQWNHLTVDAAYCYVNVEDSKPGKEVSNLDGTYKGDAHIANLSFSWTF